MLEFRDVDFRYRRRGPEVLRRVRWCPQTGRTVLLGPNGAGKSTLLRIGAGVLRPSRGEVSGTGQGMRSFAGIGYMPQSVQAVRGLTAREQVAYTGWMQGLSRTAAWVEARACLDRVGLGEQARSPSVHLSGGQLRRVGLAEAIVCRPDTLILDEPTVGLDPQERARFRSLLDEIAPLAGTVIVSTHQVDDLGELFDRVAVMDAGSMVFEAGVAEFLERGEGGSDGRRAESAYAAVLAASRR